MFPPSARTPLWLGFFAVILLAWWQMFAMVRMAGVDILGRPVAPAMMTMDGYGTLAPMWAIMMAAMMLPTLVPTLRAYGDLVRSVGAARAGWLGVLGGFFAVWVGAALVIAGLQTALMRAGALDAMGAATSLWLTGALLLVTGGFQFTRAKAICHGVCHAPTAYFLGHWRPGGIGGLRMGAALGAYCVGCCWGVMLLGFVGGVMSLLWMGAATVFMVVEKLPQLGRIVTRPAGAALIAAGAGIMLRAATA